MQSLTGFQMTSYYIEGKCSFFRCSFVGLRGGCINLEKESIEIKIKYCCFIDNCAIGKHGGAVCITGSNTAAKVSYSYATSCYTCPTNDVLAEGQFLFVNWDTPNTQNENFHEIEYLSISQCAPLIHDNGDKQRAPLYAGEGSKTIQEINISRSMAQKYNFFVLETNNDVRFNYITCHNCSTHSYIIGFCTKNSILTNVAIINPFTISEFGGFDIMDSGNNPTIITFDKSIFRLNKYSYNTMGNLFSVTLNSCQYSNLNTEFFIISGNEVPEEFTNKPIQELFLEMGILNAPNSFHIINHNILIATFFLIGCVI